MLNDIAGNGGHHQQKQRHTESGSKAVSDLLGQR
jgi:hypothetical protein